MGSGMSLWREISQSIERRILARELTPGDKLPTEFELSREFMVNRHTVRRALAVLAERGLVRATQGRGTFVEERPLAYPIGPRTRFSETVSRAGREAWGDLITARTVAADAETAEALGLAPGEFIHSFGDVHLYHNHFEQSREQLSRAPRPLPTLKINPGRRDIFGFQFEDFEIVGYDPHPHIKAEVAV